MIYYKNQEAPTIQYNGSMTIDGKECPYKEEKGIVEAADELLPMFSKIPELFYLGKDKDNLKKVTNPKANVAEAEKLQKRISDLESENDELKTKASEDTEDGDKRSIKKIDKLESANDKLNDTIKALKMEKDNSEKIIKDLSKNTDKSLLEKIAELEKEKKASQSSEPIKEKKEEPEKKGFFNRGAK